MIKLIRNLFGDGKILYNNKNEPIKWYYLEELEKLQSDDGLRAACKLTKKNVRDWRKHKMKVRVAVQTLSKSVADALEYCMSVLKLHNFKDAGPTIEFIRIFDQLFDCLNSTNPNALRFKAPLTIKNKDEWSSFFELATDYILNLKIHELPGKKGQGYPTHTLAIDTNQFTGIFGMVVCMKSTAQIFDLLVMPGGAGQQKAPLKFLLTHRFSQDHLEMFFGAIRRRGGWNNNPSSQCFEGAYKRLIILNEIKASNNGNAISIDDIRILTVSEKRNKRGKLDFKSNLISYDQEFLCLRKPNLIHINEDMESYYVDLLVNTVPFEHNYNSDTSFTSVRIPELSIYAQGVVEYIAGWCVKIIKKVIQCKDCHDALEDPTLSCNLIRIKNIGGLFVPSLEVQKICKKTETCYREVQNKTLNYILQRQIATQVTHYFMGDNIFQSLQEHVQDQDVLEGHISQLIHVVSKTYLLCRVFNATRDINRNETSVRQFYTKLILFYNQ